MSEKKTFILPDLGEGLPDATIVEWFVKVGDIIRLDEPLVSMETAKAVVEVPSPFSGKVVKLAGAGGDVIVTGTMLAEVELDPNLPHRAEAQDTGHHHGPSHAAPPPQPSPASGGGRSAVPGPFPRLRGKAGMGALRQCRCIPDFGQWHSAVGPYSMPQVTALPPWRCQ